MSIPLTIKSGGQFAERIAKRRQAWSTAQVAARLIIPPGNEWVYYQEFGTTGPYPIDVKNAPTLIFPKDGEIWEPLHVNHPGISPRRMITSVLPEIRQEALAKVSQAFADGAGDNPAVLRGAVVEAVQQAKELIVDSIAELLPGHREAGEGQNASGQTVQYSAGRLGGRTAAEVFEEEATVVETTE